MLQTRFEESYKKYVLSINLGLKIEITNFDQDGYYIINSYFAYCTANNCYSSHNIL